MKFNPNLHEETNRKVEMETKNSRRKKKTRNKPSKGFMDLERVRETLERAGDFWSIPNVLYRGKSHTVELYSGGVLEARTPDEWAKHYGSAKPAGEFHAPDFPLFYGVLKALYNSKDDSSKKVEVEEAKNFLRQSSRNNWLTTLTRIKHNPKGMDEVIHNYGTSDSYKNKVKFIGPDGEITAVDGGRACKVLLGTSDDVQKIGSIYQWLNDTPTYIWRVNNKLSSVDDRVAWFYAYSDRACLDCGWDPSDSGASLGVRLASG